MEDVSIQENDMENVLDQGSVTHEMLRRFSCSEAMLTVLNAAAGLGCKELVEASDPLCAGLLAEMDGACGALYGATLAATRAVVELY
jgi:hypothetical protein